MAAIWASQKGRWPGRCVWSSDSGFKIPMVSKRAAILGEWAINPWKLLIPKLILGAEHQGGIELEGITLGSGKEAGVRNPPHTPEARTAGSETIRIKAKRDRQRQ